MLGLLEGAIILMEKGVSAKIYQEPISICSGRTFSRIQEPFCLYEHALSPPTKCENGPPGHAAGPFPQPVPQVLPPERAPSHNKGGGRGKVPPI